MPGPPGKPNRTPAVPAGPAVKKPYLERVPQPRTDDATAEAKWRDRMRRHTEKLHDIINSLIRKGQLLQTGPADWELRPEATLIQNPEVTIIKTRALFNHHDDGPSVNTDGTEDTLYFDDLPADTLQGDGDWIAADYLVTTAASLTATRQIRLYWDGTVIMDSGTLTYDEFNPAEEGRVSIRVIISRQDSATLRIKVDSIFTAVVLQPETRYTHLAGQDFSQVHRITLTGVATGVGAAAGDIVGTLGLGQWNAGS